MHELTVCKSLIEQVLSHHQQAEQTENRHLRVSCIRLEIGPLSGVVPELLNDAWEAARKKTVLAATDLELEQTPLVVECQVCHQQSNVTLAEFSCRHCGDTRVQLVSGDQLLISEIEYTGRREQYV